MDVDKKIFAVKSAYSITEAIIPKNEKEEKEKFFKIPNYEPSFEYEEIELPSKEQIDVIKEEIKNINNRLVKKLYSKVPKCIEIEIEMLKNINTSKFTKYSKKIYGRPSLKYVKVAEELAHIKTYKKEHQKVISGKTLKEIFEDMLNVYYNLNWKIEFTDQYATSVIPTKKTIKLNKDRMFSIEEVKRLVNHEIKVHVLRSVNGYNQPYQILGTGLPKYLKTEEGLAVHMEVKQDIADAYALKLRAVRLLAVRMMLKHHSFREVFKFVKARGFDDETSWSITMRVFRGGGFTKDYVYLEGYYEVSNYLNKQTDEKMRLLYTGKIGLKDTRLIQKMLNKGLLTPPSYLPEELEEKEII
ncbi:MAG: DUF1704 domain-containing protein [Candidatus Nanohaloarchaeota archaeon]|nr:DUF1704 domain-containing protein [Candidatus Nanohaloarchaeota archaeon]